MNTNNKSARRIFRSTLILSLSVLISCGTVYFDKPQPVNSKNLKSVPEEIQGTWKTRNKYPDAVTINEDAIKIDKKSFRKYSTVYYTIARSEISKSTIYKLYEGKIFITRNGKSHSYPYRLENDSIHYSSCEVEMQYGLSDSVLIRKATGCYTVNLKYKNWWEIVFIQKSEGGNILIIYPIPEDLLKIQPDYNLMVMDSTKRDSIYFHADFKSKSIKNVINKEATIYTLFADSTFETTK
jgi:hypothetical protein